MRLPIGIASAHLKRFKTEGAKLCGLDQRPRRASCTSLFSNSKVK